MPHRWRGEDYCERTRRLSARLCQRRSSRSFWEKHYKASAYSNTFARIITRKYDKRRVTQSLKYLHWLPIKWRTDYKIAVTTYKLITTGQPQYLCFRIERYSHTLRRSLRNVDATHNSLRLVVPATKTIIRTRAFLSAAPDIWNELLSDDICQVTFVTVVPK